MSNLTPQIGDIWLKDSTPLYGDKGTKEYRVILDIYSLQEKYPENGYRDYDMGMTYIVIGSGKIDSQSFDGRVTHNGNPYFKKVG